MESYPDYESLADYSMGGDGLGIVALPPQGVFAAASPSPFSLVEPSAKVSPSAIIGPYTHVMANSFIAQGVLLEGCFIEGAKIGAYSRIYRNTHIMQNAQIGEHCLIGGNCFIADGAIIGNRVRMMLNCGIGRNTVIEDDVFLGCNITFSNNDNLGRTIPVRVCAGAWVGNNAVTTNRVQRIGKKAVIGTGAVVTRDVPDYAVVVGNPARILRWNTVDGRHPAWYNENE